MNSKQINGILKKSKLFGGIYPWDKLPKIKRWPIGLIVNTDPSNSPGEHWVAVIILRNGKGEYFDSFGLPPLIPVLSKFLFTNCPNGIVYNSATLQGEDSKACGLYCISFIKERTKGRSFKKFLSKFSLNREQNEKLVYS